MGLDIRGGVLVFLLIRAYLPHEAWPHILQASYLLLALAVSWLIWRFRHIVGFIISIALSIFMLYGIISRLGLVAFLLFILIIMGVVIIWILYRSVTRRQ